MIKLCLFLVLFVTSVTALCSGCKYSKCLVAGASDINGCDKGFKFTGTRKCCDTLLGQCISYELECRPDAGSCPWHDFNCNGDKIKDVFDGVGDDIAGEWSKLSTATQDGFKDALSFSKLTVGELSKVSSKLLSEAKAVAGLTATQLKGLGNKIVGMTAPQLKMFWSKVKKGVLKDAIKELGAASGWVYDKAVVVVDELQLDEAYGVASKWTKEKIVKVGNLVKGIRAKDVVKWSTNLITDAAVAGKFVAQQIGAIAQRTGTLAIAKFKQLYNDYAPAELKSAVAAIGKTVKWAKEKVKFLYDKLTEKGFFGNFSSWTKDTFVLLGDIVGPIVLEGKVSHINKETFKQVGVQVLRGISIASDFKDAVLEFKVEVISDVLIKVSEVFGGDVEKWTKEIVGQVGPFIINLNKLTDIPGQVIVEALPGIQKNGFNWQAVKGMAGNFATKVKQSDAMGQVKNWTAAAVTKLGDVLPIITTPAELASLPKKAFDGAAATIGAIADKSHFDKDQLKALSTKAQEAWGPVKDWSKEQLQKAGTVLAGLSKEDLIQIKDDVVSTISPYAISAMDTLKLNALGSKLQKLSVKAKNSIYGKRMTYLAARAKKSSLGLF